MLVAGEGLVTRNADYDKRQKPACFWQTRPVVCRKLLRTGSA